jgi:hypothetical protein
MGSIIRKEQDCEKATMRSKDPSRNAVLGSAIWSVKSRRFTRCRNHGGCSTVFHRAANAGRLGASPTSELEARPIRAFNMSEHTGVARASWARFGAPRLSGQRREPETP